MLQINKKLTTNPSSLPAQRTAISYRHTTACMFVAMPLHVHPWSNAITIPSSFYIHECFPGLELQQNERSGAPSQFVVHRAPFKRSANSIFIVIISACIRVHSVQDWPSDKHKYLFAKKKNAHCRWICGMEHFFDVWKFSQLINRSELSHSSEKKSHRGCCVGWKVK